MTRTKKLEFVLANLMDFSHRMRFLEIYSTDKNQTKIGN